VPRASGRRARRRGGLCSRNAHDEHPASEPTGNQGQAPQQTPVKQFPVRSIFRGASISKRMLGSRNALFLAKTFANPTVGGSDQ
jgi:hypothetical protein